MSPGQPTLDPALPDGWPPSATVMDAFRDRLPAGLAMLDDEALIDSLLRSMYFALYGQRPPADVPLTEPAPKAAPAGPPH